MPKHPDQPLELDNSLQELICETPARNTSYPAEEVFENIASQNLQNQALSPCFVP